MCSIHRCDILYKIQENALAFIPYYNHRYTPSFIQHQRQVKKKSYTHNTHIQIQNNKIIWVITSMKTCIRLFTKHCMLVWSRCLRVSDMISNILAHLIITMSVLWIICIKDKQSSWNRNDRNLSTTSTWMIFDHFKHPVEKFRTYCVHLALKWRVVNCSVVINYENHVNSAENAYGRAS